MLTFPLIDPSVAPQVGAVRGISFSTQVARSQTGLERRRVLQTIPRENLVARWAPSDDSRWVAEQVSAFFRQVGGAGVSFVAYDFDYSFSHQRIYVGTGDGTTVAWDLPCRDTASSIKVYKDGTEQTSGITLSDDGTNERKKVTFGTAPAAGVVITASFQGQRAWVCRFASDTLDVTISEADLYELEIGLTQVVGE